MGALDRLKLLLTDPNFLRPFAGAFGYMHAQGYADAWQDRWHREDGSGTAFSRCSNGSSVSVNALFTDSAR